jgi:RND family efflux transporter MFP subunit
MKNITNILLASAVLIIACKPNYQSELAAMSTESVKPVRVVELDVKDEPIPLTASGIISSKSQSVLSFKVGGIVDQILVDEGQSVEKGQLLASVDLEEIEAQVNKAQEAYSKAVRDLERFKRLYADSAATYEMVQNMETAFEVAQSDLQIATFNRRFAEIKAPVSGKILRRFVEEVELVEPGNPVFNIGENGEDAYVLRIGVADRDVVRINLEDQATYSLAAYPGQVFSAKVTEIAEAANPMTGTFEIELTLNPTQVQIKNGFVAKLELFPSGIEPYYEIPMAALVEADELNVKIFVLDENNTAKETEVVPIEIRSSSLIVPTNELPTASRIITEGSAYVRSGDQVTISTNSLD